MNDASHLPLLSEVLGDAGRFLPLTFSVEEKLGIDRTDWPIEFPLSLPRCLVTEHQTLACHDGTTVIPTQLNVLTRWPNGSAQHVIVYVAVKVAARQRRELSISGVVAASRDALVCRESDATIEIDTGAASFTIDRLGGRQIISAKIGDREFIAPGGRFACQAGAIINITDGSVFDPTSPAAGRRETRILENGPVRCVIEQAVTMSSGDGDRMTTWFVFHRQQSWVRIYSWIDRGNATRNPLVARETALVADLRYDGAATSIQQSRFDEISRDETFAVTSSASARATVVLPWLHELGMRAATNFIAKSSDGAMHIEWRPIDSPDPAQSPMNSLCWVPRYWREAALLIESSSQNSIAQAVRRTLELRDLDVRVDSAYQPHLALLDRLTILGEQEDEFRDMIRAGDSYYLSEDYPEDGIDGSEWHNWESAYFHGFAWRKIYLNERRTAYPRTMKSDLLELMLCAGALRGDSDCDRRAKLQARAFPINVASRTDGQELNFTFDDIAIFVPKPRGTYPPGIADNVPACANVGYPGRLLAMMFLMWTRTGEPMLKACFDLLYDRVRVTKLDQWPWRPFDGDRNWIVLRDLVRLYQLTEDDRYINEAHRIRDTYLPEKIAPETWYSNFHVRFWNNESLALLYRLDRDAKTRGLHESLVKDYVAEAKTSASTSRLLMPMTRSLRKKLENVGLCYQIGVAAGQWALWDESGEALKIARHFVDVGSRHGLATSPIWPGKHVRYYPADVFNDPTGIEDVPRDEAGTGQVPGEYIRTIALLAKATIPWSYDAALRRIELRIDPDRLANDRTIVCWPAGRLRIERKGDHWSFNAEVKSGRATVITGADGQHRRELAVGHQTWEL